MLEMPAAESSEPLPGGIVAPRNWILYLDKISVSFDGFRALNNLNLYIERGELRCVIGPNGAGKTTMMDVITGKTRPDEGEAFFAGTVDLLTHDEPEIASWIGRKFQKPTVFVNHTVLENLELAGQRDKRVWPSLIKRTTPEERDRAAVAINTGGGGIEQVTIGQDTLRLKGPGSVSPFAYPALSASMAACQVSMEFGLTGPVITQSAACATSIICFLDALSMIQRGEVDVVLSDAPMAWVSRIRNALLELPSPNSPAAIR